MMWVKHSLSQCIKRQQARCVFKTCFILDHLLRLSWLTSTELGWDDHRIWIVRVVCGSSQCSFYYADICLKGVRINLKNVMAELLSWWTVLIGQGLLRMYKQAVTKVLWVVTPCSLVDANQCTVFNVFILPLYRFWIAHCSSSGDRLY